MVDSIDKSLPNTVEEVKDEEFKEKEVAIPGEGIATSDTTEVVMDAEGGAEVSFDPTTVPGRQSDGHFANLAEDMGEGELQSLGSTLYDQYTEYKESRGDWEQSYREGLELLGFKYERRTEPFRGASGVNHPVLAEAVTQFQATAYKELLPSDGPVRTQILGDATIAKEQQSKRVKDFMNYQLMDQMTEYEPEFDQMLFYLPLSGSTFKKVYYDELLGRAVSKFVPAEDLIVPYSATSLEDTEAIIHIIKMSGNELRKQQVAGFYRDVKLGEPPITEDLPDDLLETAFLVRIDHRLLRLHSVNQEQTEYDPLRHSFVDDDAIATYYISSTNIAVRGARNVQDSDGGIDSELSALEMFDGPLGNRLQLMVQPSPNVKQSTALFTELGSVDVVGNSGLAAGGIKGTGIANHHFIDTMINVVGVTTGYSLDIPLRIIKKKD